MTNLARIYNDQGQWKEAEKLEQQVLEISERTLGADHPDTLRLMTNLANLANLAGTYSNQEHTSMPKWFA